MICNKCKCTADFVVWYTLRDDTQNIGGKIRHQRGQEISRSISLCYYHKKHIMNVLLEEIRWPILMGFSIEKLPYERNVNQIYFAGCYLI